MTDVAHLDYTYIFEPDEVGWTNIYQFESTMAKLLKSIGLEAEAMRSVEGVNGRRILVIRKIKDKIEIPDNKQVGRPATSGNMIRKLGEQKITK